MKKGEPVYLIYLTKTKKHKHQTKLEAKMLGLFVCKKTIWKGECVMDNRKLRYAKRKAKEKILSQRDRAYYRNLNFRENPNEQVEVSPETYAAQNASLYGRKYTDTVKAQGRKLFIRQKEREQQRKSFENKEGGQNPFLLRKALCISLPKREQACRQIVELSHQA